MEAIAPRGGCHAPGNQAVPEFPAIRHAASEVGSNWLPPLFLIPVNHPLQVEVIYLNGAGRKLVEREINRRRTSPALKPQCSEQESQEMELRRKMPGAGGIN